MAVQGVGGVSTYTAAYPVKEEKEKAENKNVEAIPEKKDSYVKGTDKDSVTYKPNTSRVDVLKADQQRRNDSLIKMVQSMLTKQGQKSNLTLFGQKLTVTPEQSAAAAASIAEGGEYSVDAVATRLIDMAGALSGGDPSKIKELRDAVDKGFKAAGKAFGGKLPDISNQTYDEVMKRFDEWEKTGTLPGYDR